MAGLGNSTLQLSCLAEARCVGLVGNMDCTRFAVTARWKILALEQAFCQVLLPQTANARFAFCLLHPRQGCCAKPAVSRNARTFTTKSLQM